MFVEYTDDQKALRSRLRKYFSNLIKHEYKEELRSAEGGDLYKSLIHLLCRVSVDTTWPWHLSSLQYLSDAHANSDDQL